MANLPTCQLTSNLFLSRFRATLAVGYRRGSLNNRGLLGKDYVCRLLEVPKFTKGTWLESIQVHTAVIIIILLRINQLVQQYIPVTSLRNSRLFPRASSRLALLSPSPTQCPASQPWAVLLASYEASALIAAASFLLRLPGKAPLSRSRLRSRTPLRPT